MGNAVDEPLSTACEGEFMPGIGVILNPYSRKYKNNPEMAKHMGFIVGDKASCKATEDLADLRRVAEEFKTRDIDILAINGGDGTIHCTLTTFLNVYGNKPLPKIANLFTNTLIVIESENSLCKVKSLSMESGVSSVSVGCLFGVNNREIISIKFNVSPSVLEPVNNLVVSIVTRRRSVGVLDP